MNLTKRILTTLLIIIILTTNIIPIVYANEGESSGTNIINSFNTYYNYYFINDTRYEYVDIYSLNNRDDDSYWRPKFNDLNINLKDQIEFEKKDLKVDKNLFDVEWEDIDKHQFPTSRGLEILGYDFLLYKDIVDTRSGDINKTIGYKVPITAPYLIMNIYKALGIELYDTYIKFDTDKSEAGIYITRTNPETYWELFLNDHPIDYNIYNDTDLENITSSRVLNTEDAITIISQMLDFYGEPVISKQEEYLLLQAYGSDVPSTLTDKQKNSWSYLKCRGIIGEDDLQYNVELSFDDMIDMLMRVKDVNSRTNYKEIQIVTNLDNSFIKNGYYENKVRIMNQPQISPIDSSIDWSTATRYDFLIEVDNEIAFRFESTGELNKDIFISKGPNHNYKPIKGSIYEGIKDGRFYHFSVPIQEMTGTDIVYLNSSKSGDYPLNYHLPISNNIGGVYSNYTIVEGSVHYSNSNTFNDILKDSTYVDSNRKGNKEAKSKTKRVYASNGITIETRYSTELLDVPKTKKVIESLGGTCVESNGFIVVRIGADKVKSTSNSSMTNVISRKLVVKDEYKYTSQQTNAILGLTGSRLLIPLNETRDINLINGYKVLQDKNILIIYTKDNDVVIIDNKNKTIQKGNTYLQIREEQDLFTFKDNGYMVDFRGLYGTKEIGFTISNDSSTGDTIVQMYNNNIISKRGKREDKDNKISSSSGEYNYYRTSQFLPYINDNVNIDEMGVDLLYKFNNTNTTTNLANNISEVVLPFSSSNPMGNYMLYGEYSSDYGIENYYLMTISPKKIITNEVKEYEYEKMFRYYPEVLKDKEYSINIMKLSSDNKYNIKNIPGVGWAQVLSRVDDNAGSLMGFMNKVINKSVSIPNAYTVKNGNPALYNFNINYISDSNTKELKSLKDVPNTNTPIPAAVGIQSWFTDPSLVPTISKNTILSKVSHSSAPKLYWGTMPLKVTSNSRSIVTKNGNMDMETYMKGMDIMGMNRISSYIDENSYNSPGIYSLVPKDFNITLSKHKDEIEDNRMNKRNIKLEEFFKQFEDVTFTNFIYKLDNSMSIVYYIVTRVVPLIILSLLTIVLLISMVSDIKLVQLFCDRVFDPVYIITFGNYNIQTVRNKYLIVSMIGALTLMGIIQMGNLEKIIMFCIKWYYAIRMFFK